MQGWIKLGKGGRYSWGRVGVDKVGEGGKVGLGKGRDG